MARVYRREGDAVAEQSAWDRGAERDLLTDQDPEAPRCMIRARRMHDDCAAAEALAARPRAP